MDKRDRISVVYICWSCGEDFEVAEEGGLSDSLEVSCPDCGSDLVAVDFAAVRHGATDCRRRGSAVRGSDGESRAGEARGRLAR
jgi:DNA-directed RNA polymerase subunit RPC12/RpoP